MNKDGIAALLQSDEIAEICTDLAKQIRDRAGDGYEVAAPHQTGQRVAVNIYPATEEAAIDNYENNTLLRAIGR